jgi:hypothetical protein
MCHKSASDILATKFWASAHQTNLSNWEMGIVGGGGINPGMDPSFPHFIAR